MTTARVVPIEPVLAVLHLIAELDEIHEDLPFDAAAPVFRVSEETQAEVCQAVPLLQEACRLLRSALDREGPRYDAYAEVAESTKQ